MEVSGIDCRLAASMLANYLNHFVSIMESLITFHVLDTYCLVVERIYEENSGFDGVLMCERL